MSDQLSEWRIATDAEKAEAEKHLKKAADTYNPTMPAIVAVLALILFLSTIFVPEVYFEDGGNPAFTRGFSLCLFLVMGGWWINCLDKIEDIDCERHQIRQYFARKERDS